MRHRRRRSSCCGRRRSRYVSRVTGDHLGSWSKIQESANQSSEMTDQSNMVPFFADDEESRATPKADAFFIPRENPRSLIIRPTDQWPSHLQNRLSLVSDLRNCTNAFVGREHNKAAMTPTRSGIVDNGIHIDNHRASSEPGAVTRPVNGATVEKMVPKLSQADYFTEPSLEELAAKERVLADHNREVIVYKDDRNKPPVGEGLNKAALVTLLNIKCMNRKTDEQYTQGPRFDKFKEMLVKKAQEQGVEFISFDGAKGEWKFRVKHFSSYGFGEAEADDLADSL
ncbi:hypothetical protein ZWY2020_034789 [Hordeum vulgare]|nr:hypothetical protein ZWY2020_034789 [Hordeum vulgare]